MTAVREGVEHLRRPIPNLAADRRCTMCMRVVRWFADENDEAGHLWCECGGRWNALGRHGWQPLTIDTTRCTTDAL